MAGLSSRWYARLEQGRAPLSASVLASLVKVLHLDGAQRDRLFELAGEDIINVCRRPAQRVQPHVRQMLDDLRYTPAFVLGRYMDVLALNPLAAALITDFSQVPVKRRNFLRVLFTDPAMRTLYPAWESVAHACVTQLRTEGAKCPGDARLVELVGELSMVDPQFRQWWGAPLVTPVQVGTKTLRHPLVGELVLSWDSFTCTADVEQRIVIWTAEAGTPSHDSLRLLSTWIAQPSEAPSNAA